MTNPIRKFHFNQGYYQCQDDLIIWLNALDTSEMEVKDFRSALWHHLMETRPSEPRGDSNEEEDSV